MGRKKKDSITLSEKHGVNPSFVICTLCGEDTGEIALLGKLKDDKEAPRHICTGTICKKCKEQLEKDRMRCFVDFSTGQWIKINDEDISKEYLEEIKDIRWIPVSHDNFVEVFGNTESHED